MCNKISGGNSGGKFPKARQAGEEDFPPPPEGGSGKSPRSPEIGGNCDFSPAGGNSQVRNRWETSRRKLAADPRFAAWIAGAAS